MNVGLGAPVPDDLADLGQRGRGGFTGALGAGGPRSWPHLTAIAAHVPAPARARVPQEWLDHVEATMGRSAPTRMGDLPEESLPIWVQPRSMGHNPESPIDRAIMATRQAVFSHHGLDPWFD